MLPLSIGKRDAMTHIYELIIVGCMNYIEKQNNKGLPATRYYSTVKLINHFGSKSHHLFYLLYTKQLIWIFILCNILAKEDTFDSEALKREVEKNY